MKNPKLSDIVKIMDVKALKPYPNNPRRNERAVEAVANSISRFGFKVPVIVDKDFIVIAGHTRLKAAKSLGLTEVPVIVADDLTPEQVKAFRLADNKTAEIAAWDFELLDLELEELSLADFDMSPFGFGEEIDDADSAEHESGEAFGEEVDLDGFADEAFAHVCPRCGFRFKDKR